MNSVFKYILLLTAVFVCVIDHSLSIKCYKCKSSNRDSNCGYPTPTNGLEIDDCPTADSRCFHYDYNVEGHRGFEQFVERGCMIGSTTICPSKKPESPDIHFQCKFCEEDRCNAWTTQLKPLKNDTGTGGGNGGGGSSLTPMLFIVCGAALMMLIINIRIY